jgi:hypothetical protein
MYASSAIAAVVLGSFIRLLGALLKREVSGNNAKVFTVAIAQ